MVLFEKFLRAFKPKFHLNLTYGMKNGSIRVTMPDNRQGIVRVDGETFFVEDHTEPRAFQPNARGNVGVSEITPVDSVTGAPDFNAKDNVTEGRSRRIGGVVWVRPRSKPGNP